MNADDRQMSSRGLNHFQSQRTNEWSVLVERIGDQMRRLIVDRRRITDVEMRKELFEDHLEDEQVVGLRARSSRSLHLLFRFQTGFGQDHRFILLAFASFRRIGADEELLCLH